MSFLDYLISVDARTALMGSMMQKLGVDKQLKVVPDHVGVTNRAVDRCRSCGHQDECSTGLMNTSKLMIRQTIAATAT
ncbi:DUF6455 family protein [Mesorhizobium sp. M0220]|uniref:DUF6455 family protein n=1 Tax=Mesorhizobium sp. M0220 TaxID=2956920 RepID=UPI003337F860